MSLRYGFNIGKSDMKSLLEEYDKQMSGIRSWKQLFGGASQDYAAQNSAIVSSYSDTIAQAYKASMAQNDAIASAGFNTGATRELIESNRAALHDAYQTYIQNYGKAVESNMQNYADTQATYDAELSARAENFSKLYNYAYQYLAEELAGSEYQGTSWLTANNLDWLYDTELDAAKPWETLAGALFNRDTGEITNEGREFFDAMFNARTEGFLTSEGKGTRGFDQWLSDTDAELRDWAVQGDAYNYARAGSNFGTAKSLLGLESIDQSYGAYEYVHNAKAALEEIKNTTISHDDKTLKKIDKLDTKVDRLTERSARDEELYGISLGRDILASIREARLNNKTEKLQGYLNKYADAYQTQIDDVNTKMKEALGAIQYSSFERQNKTLIDDLTRMLRDIRVADNGDIVENKELENLYLEYIKRLEIFINNL